MEITRVKVRDIGHDAWGVYTSEGIMGPEQLDGLICLDTQEDESGMIALVYQNKIVFAQSIDFDFEYETYEVPNELSDSKTMRDEFLLKWALSPSKTNTFF